MSKARGHTIKMNFTQKHGGKKTRSERVYRI